VKIAAVVLFFAGLLLAVRVMFFGVQQRRGEEELHHRRWPLALASFLAIVGLLLYVRSGRGVTVGWGAVVLLAGALAAVGAWVLVQRSAAIPSTDPEDDPRYRFQGHVARVVSVIDAGAAMPGRIAFEFDGKQFEFGARWSPEADLGGGQYARAGVNDEVVIEYVDGDLAYVEPWVVVEKRL
jgi:hypothetical protein